MQNSTNGPTQDEMRQALSELCMHEDENKRPCVPVEYQDADPEKVPTLASICRRDCKNGVYFMGVPGIGKTYAATALAKKLIAAGMIYNNPVTGAWYYKAKELAWASTPYLLARIRSTFRQRSTETEMQIIDRMTWPDILVLDDLGAENKTEFTGATLYTIISERRNACKITIITTNQTLDDIDAWEPRIASRMSEMLAVRLPGKDWRMGR